MTTHTPGPWTVRADRGRYGTFQINPFAKEERAHLTKQPNAITLRGQKVQFEREANARLIAAAPDLLAALENAVANAEEALDFMDCRPKYDDHPLKPLLHAIRMPARAAIAKARGQSNG